jgi:5-methylcytosine-specific restriction endonuclease McrA
MAKTTMNSRKKRQVRQRIASDRRARCTNPYCNKVERLTIDHVVPLSQGGTDNIHNLQLLCRACNTAKGDRIIDYRKLRRRLEKQVQYV